jgi:Flp pilus assembly protein TadG
MKAFLFRLRQSRFIRSDSGQSLVEISLVLPLLVFGLLAGADLARAFAVQLAVQNGARAGAESYAIDSTPSQLEARNAAVAEMNRTPTITATIGNVSVIEAQSDGVTTCVHPPPSINPCYVTVRVTYTWRAVTQWPWVPSSANFDRTTIFQMFY